MYFNNGKYNREGKNSFDGQYQLPLILRGKVVGILDSFDAGRIQVRIAGQQNHLKDDKCPTAFPMLPKHLNIVPKIGEAVLLFRFNSEDKFTDMMYMGPITPQLQNLDHADFNLEAWNAFSFGTTELGPAVTKRKKLIGGYPNQEDVALLGRKNTDLILKDNEVLLRAGKFVFKGDNADNTQSANEFDKKLGYKFNNRTQGYIQIKYNSQINVPEEGSDTKEYGTITNIVSNKINLLTHKEGNPRFTLTNQENLISDEEMQTILKTAHPIAFGDKVVEIFKLVISAVANHSHKYAGLPPHGEGQSESAKAVQDMIAYDLEQILSKNIRIN